MSFVWEKKRRKKVRVPQMKANMLFNFAKQTITISEFHNLELELTLKALAELQATGKAAVFGTDRSDQLVQPLTKRDRLRLAVDMTP